MVEPVQATETTTSEEVSAAEPVATDSEPTETTEATPTEATEPPPVVEEIIEQVTETDPAQ